MTFKDTKNHWASKEIAKAANLELLKGYPDGTFRPEEKITRAESAVLSTRLYDATKETFEDLVDKVEPAVVMVSHLETGAIGSGTSIGNGFILTNAHVVLNEEGKTYWHYGIRWDSWGYGDQGNAQYAEGPCVFVSPGVDLAIIRADIGKSRRPTMPSLPLGNAKEVRRGMPVTIIGSPVGLAGTVTQGVVSYVDRYLTYQQEDGTNVTIPDAIQTDAPINPGNSGGALVNRRGELIGVPSVKLVSVAMEGLGFAIGLDTVRKVIADADKSGVLAAAYRADLLAAFSIDDGLTLV